MGFTFTDHEVVEGRQQMAVRRRSQLKVGDILAAEWADTEALGEYCAKIGLSVSTAREWRATASAVSADLRALLEDGPVMVSYSVLREGARTRSGAPADPGYVKLRRMIAEAEQAGRDRVTWAAYRTVLDTAPTLTAVMNPAKRTDRDLLDFQSELQHDPDRELLFRALAAKEAQLKTAAAEVAEAKRAMAAGSRKPADPGERFTADLAVIWKQAEACKKRYRKPGTVVLDQRQAVRCSEIIGSLRVVLGWAEQTITDAVPAAAAPKSRTRRAARTLVSA